MKKNKRAVFYGVTVLIFTIFMLVWALGASIKKTTHEKTIGEEQIELMKEYSKGESILFYVDQSAKYSFYNAVYSFAKKGTYFNEPECGYYLEEYMLWGNVIEDGLNYREIYCYPEERDIAMNFALFLNNQLDEYFEGYPSDVIPKDNYDFNFDAGEIRGIATRNVILNKSNVTIYSINPSFKMNVSYDFIGRIKNHVEKTLAIRDNIYWCLSGAVDNDLETCSDIEKLKTEIEGIGGYKIGAISSVEKYTLLFDIKDDSFENPYSDGELILKFGISFIPPVTEIMDIDIQNGLNNDPKDITI